ncbi:O-antigen ligase family protein [Castellaniella sp.]|uniref:O-antigen ligase family protein n=1 Tax=Castellaniella sp. TaxID=1955812 RepID=UPI003A9167A9
MPCLPTHNNTVSRLTELGTFVFFAAMFAVLSGYSYGGALLLLASLIWLYQRPAREALHADDRRMLVVLALYFIVPTGMTLWLGNNPTDIDQYSRALLAIPIFLLVLAVPVRLSTIWAAIALGVTLSAPLAWWQIHIQHMDRASGFLNIIHFSNLTLVFTVYCVAGLYWAGTQGQHANRWRASFLLAIACGLYSMIVGGSRGSWVALAPVIVVFLLAFLTRRNIGRLAAIAIVGIIIVASLFALPDSTLQERYDQAVHDVTLYQEDQADSSIGARFEMWRGALHNLQQQPILGWNQQDYTQALKNQVAQDTLDPVALAFSDNLHNNYLQAWVFTGLPGLLALLALYGLPLWHFAKQLRASNLTIRVLAFCGTSTVVSYLCFSLSQVILRRNNGIMFYLLAVVILWGALRQQHSRNPEHLHGLVQGA